MTHATPLGALRFATVAVGALWLPLIVLWGDLPHMLTFDDAFYYFTIGRNIAEGAGSTFDGMHPTNGYHPAWMVVSAGVYLLGFDGVGAIRALLVVQLAAWLGALWVLARVVANAVGGWPAFAGRDDRSAAATRGVVLLGALWFAVAANPFVLKLFVNGMETGLAALLGAALLGLSVQEDGDPLRRPVPAGALLVLAFLARTDVAVILAALFVWTVLRRRRLDRSVLLVGVALAAAVAAYLASNVAIVDHPMQISGTIKRVDLDGGRAATLLACLAAAGAVLVLGLRAASPSTTTKLPRTRAWIATTGWWPAGALVLLGYEWGFTVEIYLWHYAPQALWGVVLLVSAAADIYEGATVERPAGAADARSLGVAGILLVPLAAAGAWQVGEFVDGEIRSMQLGDRAAAEWIADNLPADAVVASWDAGVIGYFAERPVVNLDGLVNSYEWRDAREAGTTATRAFLLESGVTHIANHGDVAAGEDPDMVGQVSGLLGPDAGSAIELVHRVDYVFAGSAGGVSGRRPYATFVYEVPLR